MDERAAPAFLTSDARRARYTWTSWAEIATFLAEHRSGTIAVHDTPWPYAVGMSFVFDGAAFHLRFSRTGKLATALRADPHCTITVYEVFGIDEDPAHDTRSVRYRSIVARCEAEVRDHDIGEGRTIAAVTARVISMSAKERRSA